MANYDPVRDTRAILQGQVPEPDLGPPPPPRRGPARSLSPAPGPLAAPVDDDPVVGPRRWGSRKGRVWQVHVTLTPEAAELLEKARRSDESVAVVVIRVLREAHERLSGEFTGEEQPSDFFEDPVPPERRYRVPNGVRKHFDLTSRQREGLTQFMESIGARNLSFVVTQAVMIVLGNGAKGRQERRPSPLSAGK